MNDLKDRKQELINSIAETSVHLPSVVIVFNIQNNLTVEYMSQKGLDILGTTLEEIIAIGEEYHVKYFNVEDPNEYVVKIQNVIQRNNLNEICTFFQQVRPTLCSNWEWYLISAKIIMRDDAGSPYLLIAEAVQIEAENSLTQRVEKLLEENIFMRNNFAKYALLTRREKEVLQLLAALKSNKEIAEELYLSVGTVETHKKNIKQKLNIKTAAELALFARGLMYHK